MSGDWDVSKGVEISFFELCLPLQWRSSFSDEQRDLVFTALVEDRSGVILDSDKHIQEWMTTL